MWPSSTRITNRWLKNGPSTIMLQHVAIIVMTMATTRDHYCHDPGYNPWPLSPWPWLQHVTFIVMTLATTRDHHRHDPGYTTRPVWIVARLGGRGWEAQNVQQDQAKHLVDLTKTLKCGYDESILTNLWFLRYDESMLTNLWFLRYDESILTNLWFLRYDESILTNF